MGKEMNEHDAAVNDPYPHVKTDEREMVERFGHLLNNTGGNDPLDLLNDFNRPSPNNLMAVNIVRFTLAMGVHTQVGLLRRLINEGLING